MKARTPSTGAKNHSAQDRAELQRLRERLALTPTQRWERFVASMRSLQEFQAAATQHRRKARREKDRSDLKALRLIQREQSSHTSAGATEG